MGGPGQAVRGMVVHLGVCWDPDGRRRRRRRVTWPASACR